MSTQVSEQELREAVASTWWIPLIQGIVALLFGFYALTRTADTLAAILWIVGVYWLISGIFGVLSGLFGKTDRSRLWQLIGGGLSIAAGAFALGHPLMAGAVSASFVATLVGISAIFGGLVQMFAGREVQEGAGLQWSLGSFLTGLLNVIFGLIVVSNPLFASALFIRLIAWITILGGISLLFVAYRVKSIA